jgi:hypothetical protein
MNGNPIIVDLLMNIFGLCAAMYVAYYFQAKRKNGTGLSASVACLFLALFFYIAARCFHMNFLLVLSSQGITWERADVYLFWAFIAAIAASYFCFVKK